MQCAVLDFFAARQKGIKGPSDKGFSLPQRIPKRRRLGINPGVFRA
jgi:hypothetical protein